MRDVLRHSVMTDIAKRLLSPAPATFCAVLLAVGLGLAGCASSGSDEAAGSDTVAADEPQARTSNGLAVRSRTAIGADGKAPSDTSSLVRTADVDREPGSTAAPAIIRTGTLSVQSDDVARARFDLEKVVDSHSGSIADEKTTASTEGEVRLSRLELRIPSDEFDAAMTGLAELGKVTASTRKAQDVTGEVIDTQARIRAQEMSLERIEVLFARAQNIRDIVAIEAQLSRRQAELDSLTGQLAYLEDQTSLSSITVYLELAPGEPPPAGRDDNAFVGGLKDGWHALGELGAGLATVVGALLPFAVVALLLGVPAALAARRWLATHPMRRPAAEA